LPTLLVRSSGHHSARLVEQEINLGGGGDRLTIHFDPIAPQVDVRLRIATDCTIQPHSPRVDKIACFGARAIAELRESASQAHLPGAIRASHASMLNEGESFFRHRRSVNPQLSAVGSFAPWHDCRRPAYRTSVSGRYGWCRETARYNSPRHTAGRGLTSPKSAS
jgi:hypothetical protein